MMSRTTDLPEPGARPAPGGRRQIVVTLRVERERDWRPAVDEAMTPAALRRLKRALSDEGFSLVQIWGLDGPTADEELGASETGCVHVARNSDYTDEH